MSSSLLAAGPRRLGLAAALVLGLVPFVAGAAGAGSSSIDAADSAETPASESEPRPDDPVTYKAGPKTVIKGEIKLFGVTVEVDLCKIECTRSNEDSCP